MDLLIAKVICFMQESIRIWGDIICSSWVCLPISIKCGTRIGNHSCHGRLIWLEVMFKAMPTTKSSMTILYNWCWGQLLSVEFQPALPPCLKFLVPSCLPKCECLVLYMVSWLLAGWKFRDYCLILIRVKMRKRMRVVGSIAVSSFIIFLVSSKIDWCYTELLGVFLYPCLLCMKKWLNFFNRIGLWSRINRYDEGVILLKKST